MSAGERVTRVANLIIPEVLIGEVAPQGWPLNYTNLRRCAGFFLLRARLLQFPTIAIPRCISAHSLALLNWLRGVEGATIAVPEVLIGECFKVRFAYFITYTDLRRSAGFFLPDFRPGLLFPAFLVYPSKTNLWQKELVCFSVSSDSFLGCYLGYGWPVTQRR